MINLAFWKKQKTQQHEQEEMEVKVLSSNQPGTVAISEQPRQINNNKRIDHANQEENCCSQEKIVKCCGYCALTAIGLIFFAYIAWIISSIIFHFTAAKSGATVCGSSSITACLKTSSKIYFYTAEPMLYCQIGYCLADCCNTK